MFAPLQQSFAEALFDPSQAVPADISACHAEASAKRFNIYRNNVTVSLLDALAARFPVTQKIVGEDFFKNMSRVFIKAHPPTSPLMMFYGDGFPAFIASFEPAAEISYLADIGHLEAARTRAYHAQDCEPLDPALLQTIDAKDLAYVHFKLHPSAEIISSRHPIVTIWAMNTGLIPLGEIPEWEAEDALVARPHFDVDVRRLPLGGTAFLRSLGSGKSLAEANAEALAHHKNFDLGINLAGLFSAGLAISLSIVSPEDIKS
jgi:hypothetical protein